MSDSVITSPLIIGQRVRAARNLYQSATEEIPGGLYAKEGEILIVRKINLEFHYPVAVSHEDITDSCFGVTYDEVKPV